MTSSKRLHESLHHLKCTRDHVLQPRCIWPDCRTFRAVRDIYIYIYPRKFGRLVAKTLLKIHFPMENPAGSIADVALNMLDALAAEANAATVKERPSKRCKLTPWQGVKTPAAAGASDRSGDAKRIKVEKPTVSNPESTASHCQPASEQVTSPTDCETD